MIIFATGFDAMTGALDRIDIRGRDGLPLREAWADGHARYSASRPWVPEPLHHHGAGEPVGARQHGGVREQHVEWIGELLTYIREHGRTTVEPTVEAQDAWVELVNRVAADTMYTAPTCNSWYLGDNIPGKVRVFLPWAAGLPSYVDRCDASWPPATRGSPSR